MKKVFSFLVGVVLMLTTTSSFGQSSPSIFFQAVAKDANNNLAANKSIFIQTSILDNATSTTPLLIEQFSTSTDDYGMFGVNVGGGTRVGGSTANIQSIDWSNPSKYLNIKVSFATSLPGVNDPSWINLGTTAFGAVPYALYAGSAGGSLGKQDLLDSIRAKLKATDTISLSNRINSEVTRATNVEALKLNISDTTTMLSKYYNKTVTDSKLLLKLNTTDTASLSTRINNEVIRATNAEATINISIGTLSTTVSTKANQIDLTNEATRATTAENLRVKYTDTASMLSAYYNKTVIDYKLALKVNVSDTAAMLNTRFARDTVSLSNRINAITTNVGTKHTIGESYGGGIIVYLESDNIHGLIAAVQDGYNGNNASLPWVPTGSNLNYLGAKRDGLYAGRINTERIITSQTTGVTTSAATFIGNTVLNGYGDWYLPSSVE